MKPKNIYVAGPMRGIAEFNFPLFHKVSVALRKLKHTVLSHFPNLLRVARRVRLAQGRLHFPRSVRQSGGGG